MCMLVIPNYDYNSTIADYYIADLIMMLKIEVAIMAKCTEAIIAAYML